MKLVLSRKEVKAITNFIKESNNILGESTPMIDNLKEQVISTKALCLSIITGSITVELKEEFIVEFYGLITSVTRDCAPALKSILTLCQSLIPVLNNYQSKFDSFTEKYTSEKAEKIVDNREAI